MHIGAASSALSTQKRSRRQTDALRRPQASAELFAPRAGRSEYNGPPEATSEAREVDLVTQIVHGANQIIISRNHTVLYALHFLKQQTAKQLRVTW